MDIRHLHLKAFDALRAAKQVVVVSHRKPDGDSLGAALAFMHACRDAGIACGAFCTDAPASQYGFLPGIREYTRDAGAVAAADVVAVFDAGDLRYCGLADVIEAMSPRPTILNFDHHATNERFGDVNIVDVGASSTTDVVYRFFADVGLAVGRDAAACLLTGLLTDTQSFSNPATTARALVTTSDLLRCGAKLAEVDKHLMRNKPLNAMQVWGAAMARLKFHEGLGLATSAVFLADLHDVDDEHIEGLSNFLSHHMRVPAVLVLKEAPGGKVKGSLRTREELDVSVIATALGGGGHKKAAGFMVSGSIIETEFGWRVMRAAQ